MPRRKEELAIALSQTCFYHYLPHIGLRLLLTVQQLRMVPSIEPCIDTQSSEWRAFYRATFTCRCACCSVD
eukprot:1855305-Pleurochrysis_carterae.AAC.4